LIYKNDEFFTIYRVKYDKINSIPVLKLNGLNDKICSWNFVHAVKVFYVFIMTIVSDTAILTKKPKAKSNSYIKLSLYRLYTSALSWVE